MSEKFPKKSNKEKLQQNVINHILYCGVFHNEHLLEEFWESETNGNNFLNIYRL